MHAELHGVEPVEGRSWSGLSSFIFKALVRKAITGGCLRVEVKAAVVEEARLSVILYSASPVSLNEKLVEKGLARAKKSALS